MDNKSYQKWWEGVVMRNNGDGQGRKVLLVQQESTLGRELAVNCLHHYYILLPCYQICKIRRHHYVLVQSRRRHTVTYTCVST